jgi:hypothetical protein
LVVVREVGSFEVSELVPVTRLQSTARTCHYAVGSGAVRVILFAGFKTDRVGSWAVKGVLTVGFRAFNTNIPSVVSRVVNTVTPCVGSGTRLAILFVGFQTDRVRSGAVKKAILSVRFRAVNTNIPSVGSRAVTHCVGSGTRSAILSVGFQTDKVRSGAVKKAILSIGFRFRAVNNIGAPSAKPGAAAARVRYFFQRTIQRKIQASHFFRFVNAGPEGVAGYP